MKKIPSVALAALAVLASACASERMKREGASGAPLNGMVYDWENRPVAGAELWLGGELRARSDISGRFSLGELSFGVYELEVRKRGYETAAFPVEYRDPTCVVYGKLPSARQLLAAAGKEAEARRWPEAIALLDRSDALGDIDPAARYLRAVLLARLGDYPGSRLILEELLEGCSGEPYVHLFLADLLQFRFADLRGAVAHLEKYLAARNDPGIERRLEELRRNAGCAEPLLGRHGHR